MVHFVGAGCGAPDLITLRGKNLLEKADVVIYAGSLVNPKLLDYTKADCEIYDSAKMTLEEVMDVTLAAEKAGKMIVRLHSGDTSLYGAIREQMDILDENGIEYDVCPGVSAFCGAASSLKVEYTLPDVSQTVIITRAPGKTASVPERESLRSLASHGSTMILFLSTGLLDYLEKELVSGGFTPDTPAAIVYCATWEDEKIFRCTISTLKKTAEENGITKTALICVGGVFGDDKAKRSKLYDPGFSTEFREAVK